jgi:DNA-binding response OmpR family regulator
VDDSAIVVYINRLRNKIETDPSRPEHIQTVRGLGYRFVP